MGISQHIPKQIMLILCLESQVYLVTVAISAVLTNYAVLCVALEEINAETRDNYGIKAGIFG